MDFSFDNLNYNSIENVPGFEARAAFTVNSATVFKEDVDIVPTIVDETLSYIPWGGNNQLPFNIIDLIEKDETLSTCHVFNAEVGHTAHRKNKPPDFLKDFCKKLRQAAIFDRRSLKILLNFLLPISF